MRFAVPGTPLRFPMDDPDLNRMDFELWSDSPDVIRSIRDRRHLHRQRGGLERCRPMGVCSRDEWGEGERGAPQKRAPPFI